MIFGAIPPPRNFAKIRTRGGRGLQPEQPKDSIPPLGAQRNAAARGGGCAGAGRARREGGGVPRRAGRGRAFAGRSGGLSGAEAGAFSPGDGPPTGRGRDLAAWGPQRPRVGRDGAGRARFRAAGRGRYTAGGPGIAGGGGLIAGRDGRRRRTGEKRSELRGLCRVTGHRWEGRQRRGRKRPVFAI